MIPLTIWGVARELWPLVRELVVAAISGPSVAGRRRAELALVRLMAKADEVAMKKLRGEP